MNLPSISRMKKIRQENIKIVALHIIYFLISITNFVVASDYNN